jgi:hypothetical protein
MTDLGSALLAFGSGALLAIILIALVVHFIPAIIGYQRGVTHAGALLLVNLLIGWTLIGWVVCLIWAIFARTQAEDDRARFGSASSPVPPPLRADEVHSPAESWAAYAREADIRGTGTHVVGPPRGRIEPTFTRSRDPRRL